MYALNTGCRRMCRICRLSGKKLSSASEPPGQFYALCPGNPNRTDMRCTAAAYVRKAQYVKVQFFVKVC